AIRIWQNGGVPFQFSTPVMCDGTAQSNQGMSYSLQSRNAVAQMVVNQLEAHSYHGTFVIQGCDKQPLGVVSALAHLDRVRRERGEAPFFATFAPAHVLKGGTIPPKLYAELEEVARRAELAGEEDIAYDLRDALSYILQCTSNTAFQGVLERARGKGIITKEQHED
ncbi:dihydroxy-acid dehydratase, partial [Geobacillus sp. PA-3]|uniref:dihydroxy-acid dehydratase domain-containing protein n=1 Tax=Geobacillus sp. PA-3 TaxID=1699078 RepID=UPI000B32478E